MKVYIATAGEYSDRRVTGVYSTMDQAQKLNDWHACTNTVEEFELDAPVPSRGGLSVWHVMMDHDGDSEPDRTWREDNDRPMDGIEYSFKHIKRRINKQSPKVRKRAIEAYVLARDAEHALKILNELRTRLLAENRFHTAPLNTTLYTNKVSGLTKELEAVKARVDRIEQRYDEGQYY